MSKCEGRRERESCWSESESKVDLQWGGRRSRLHLEPSPHLASTLRTRCARSWGPTGLRSRVTAFCRPPRSAAEAGRRCRPPTSSSSPDLRRASFSRLVVDVGHGVGPATLLTKRCGAPVVWLASSTATPPPRQTTLDYVPLRAPTRPRSHPSYIRIVLHLAGLPSTSSTMSDMEQKLSVVHLETTSGVNETNVSELQVEIDKIALLSDDERKAEERKLLRKVRRPPLPSPFPSRRSSRFATRPADRLDPAPDALHPPHLELPRCVLSADSCLLRRRLTSSWPRFADRNALASARVQGIEADLGMTGTNFNVRRPLCRELAEALESKTDPAHRPRRPPSRSCSVRASLPRVLSLQLTLHHLPRSRLHSCVVPPHDLLEPSREPRLTPPFSVFLSAVGQIPSNAILARSRPSIYLSCCVCVWCARLSHRLATSRPNFTSLAGVSSRSARPSSRPTSSSSPSGFFSDSQKAPVRSSRSS